MYFEKYTETNSRSKKRKTESTEESVYPQPNIIYGMETLMSSDQLNNSVDDSVYELIAHV